MGAINGAAIAADPSAEGVQALTKFWGSLADVGMFTDTMLARVSTLARHRTHLYSPGPLRELLTGHLPDTFEELAYHSSASLPASRSVRALVQRGQADRGCAGICAVPGLLPPVKIKGEHFLDGGLVHSIPVGRALALGATEIFVLHVGRIEQPLKAPKSLWDVCLRPSNWPAVIGSSRRWPICRRTFASTSCPAGRTSCR